MNILRSENNTCIFMLFNYLPMASEFLSDLSVNVLALFKLLIRVYYKYSIPIVNHLVRFYADYSVYLD
jgi:hypothetical protein